MEDEKIIELYWERNQTAIAQTQEKYGRYCERIAGNIVHNLQDAQECVNDTWMRAWNSMPKERPQFLGAFLGAITRNLSLDCYRRNHSQKRGGGELTYIYEELRDCVGSEESDAYVQHQELLRVIDGFLTELDAETRVIFVRRYWYADKISAIAARLFISESKVKSSLHRSRRRLRKLLEKEGFVV